MNLDFLKNEIIPQREKEIEEGKNAATSQPIYIVFDLDWFPVSGHTDYSPVINMKGKHCEYGYIDLKFDPEDREFELTDEGMTKPKAVTKIYYDKVVAFFLTSKAAHEYISYQKHNLTNPYVFVFHSGYRNLEMDNLLQGK